MITLSFLGAAGGVTGSKHLLQVGQRKILLDCGLHQGRPENVDPLNHRLNFEPMEITDVILSHGHLDHCGSIPTIVRRGFTGKIWATAATREVSLWIMKDSAHIQKQDFEYGTKKCNLSTKECSEPLYSDLDVDTAMTHFRDVPYGQWHVLDGQVRFKFYDAGHILGSAVTVVEIIDNGRIVRLGFSGDLGRKHMPILRDPQYIQEPLDYWLTESTYGDRLHGDRAHLEERLTKVINRVISRKGKILAPAFSLGRTQELVYILHSLHKRGLIPSFPIFVDSPLAASITQVFIKHLDCVDTETREEFIMHGENPFGFRNLTYTRDRAASQLLNEAKGPLMILSAAGMANAGRIQHHLLHGLPDPKNLVLITCFMAKNTLGRLLKEGAEQVRIFDKTVAVRAEISVFDEFSAHADYNELLEYASHIPNGQQMKKIYLIHGETEAAQSLQAKFQQSFPTVKTLIPEIGEQVEL